MARIKSNFFGYAERVEVLHGNLRLICEIHEKKRAIVDSEKAKWKDWDETQRDFVKESTYLNANDFVYVFTFGLVERWAEIRYLCSTRRKLAYDIHKQSLKMQTGKLDGRVKALLDECNERVGRLDEQEKKVLKLLR